MSAATRGWTRTDPATGRWMIREVDTFRTIEEAAAFIATHGDCRITVDGERVTTPDENVEVELARGDRRVRGMEKA